MSNGEVWTLILIFTYVFGLISTAIFGWSRINGESLTLRLVFSIFWTGAFLCFSIIGNSSFDNLSSLGKSLMLSLVILAFVDFLLNFVFSIYLHFMNKYRSNRTQIKEWEESNLALMHKWIAFGPLFFIDTVMLGLVIAITVGICKVHSIWFWPTAIGIGGPIAGVALGFFVSMKPTPTEPIPVSSWKTSDSSYSYSSSSSHNSGYEKSMPEETKESRETGAMKFVCNGCGKEYTHWPSLGCCNRGSTTIYEVCEFTRSNNREYKGKCEWGIK